MKIDRTVWFGFSLLIWSHGFGQEAPLPPPLTSPNPPPLTLSLKECIQRGIKIAPAIASALADESIVEAKLTQAKAAYVLPDVKMRFFGGPVPDVPDGSGPSGGFPPVHTDLTKLGPFLQTRIEAIQPVYTFGKLSNLKLAAEKGVEAKEAQVRSATNNVIQNIKRVYNGIVTLRTVLDFITELNERATSAKEKVDQMLRKKSGEVTQIDRMRLEVFFAETERNAIDVRNGIDLGMKTLGILTGGLDSPPVSPEDQTLLFKDMPLKPVENYIERSKVIRPELTQVKDLVEVRRALMKANQADFFPLFFIGGFYNYGKAPGREDISNPFLTDDSNVNSGGVALGFEQKLSFHMTNGKYREARAEYEKSLADQRLANLGIELEIRKAYSQAISKRDAMKTARDGFKAGRSWVTATTLNFGVGLVPVKDLLEAFVAYSKVKLGYFDTIHDFDEALTELAHAVGEDIVD